MHERLKRYKLHASVLGSAIAIVTVSRIHLYMMGSHPAYVGEHGALFVAFLSIFAVGIVVVLHVVWYLLVERRL